MSDKSIEYRRKRTNQALKSNNDWPDFIVVLEAELEFQKIAWIDHLMDVEEECEKVLSSSEETTKKGRVCLPVACNCKVYTARLLTLRTPSLYPFAITSTTDRSRVAGHVYRRIASLFGRVSLLFVVFGYIT